MRRRKDPKVEALRAERSLNPRPEAVTDGAFAASELLDARDLDTGGTPYPRGVHPGEDDQLPSLGHPLAAPAPHTLRASSVDREHG